MEKFLLITTIAFATIAAAPATTKGTAIAATKTDAAAQQANDSGTATPTGAAVEEKKICKALPSSGTRFTKRACLTNKEWKQVEEEVQGDNGY